MPKLTDTQAILLSTASQRADGGLLPAPDTLTADAARIAGAVAALIKRGLASEVEVADVASAIRTDDGIYVGAVITDAGRTAIGVEPVEPAGGEGTTIDPDVGSSGADAGAAGDELRREPRQTKAALVLTLLGREQGATLAELVDATGWQPHTTRAALTGLRKKGHALENRKRDTVTCYHLVMAA